MEGWLREESESWSKEEDHDITDVIHDIELSNALAKLGFKIQKLLCNNNGLINSIAIFYR